MALLAAAGNTLAADAYPTRAIRWIVPYTPAGTTDIVARIVGQRLAERLGRTIVIDNRPGAGNNIGTEIAVKSAPDGYTWFLTNPANAINATLYGKLNFNFLNDMAPAAALIRVPNVMAVTKNLPARNVQEFIALAKAKPRTFNYASSGIGGLIHLTGELFKTGAGTEMTHVPYKGMATAYPDVIAGLVQLAIGAQLSSVPHVKSGKLRVIGVTSAKRMPSLPDAPTIAESGITGFEVVQWYGIATHKQTPAATVQTLNREIVKALQLPDVKSRLEADGSVPAGSTPQALDAFMRSELVKWDKVIKSAGIKRE